MASTRVPYAKTTSIQFHCLVCFRCRCYECGEFGHLSFHCPKNMLGDRAQPEKKKRKRKKSEVDGEPSGSGATAMEPESDGEEEDDWSLGQAIR